MTSRTVSALALFLTLLAGGCATAPKPHSLACADAPAAPITVSADGRAHLRVDVMTYNIEGLGWPARGRRGAELAQIGRRLAELRRIGEAPDIIVFQEMFSRAAAKAVRKAGYPAEVAGPSQFERRGLPADGRVPGHRDWDDGELGVRMAGGGLAIVSRWPIDAWRAEPFSHRACAGLDCLSNKGALFAEIAIPGVPEPIQVFDSHMNSRHASRAPLDRTLAAHRVETEELADFIAAYDQPAFPTLLAGDFNMRHSAARFALFERAQPLTLVQRYCRGEPGACDVEIAWKDDTPWLDTEDLQFFRKGANVDVRPVRVVTMFDGAAGGPVLSDHSAVRVTYDLSWPAEAPPAPGACGAGLPQRRS